jgi:hypothetical protein
VKMIKLYNIRIHYLLRLIVFWLLYFAFFRISFIIYHHAKIPDGQHSETSLSFFYALRLDIATVCGGIIIPYVLWSFQQFYKNKTIHFINLTYNILLIAFVSMLSIFNMKLYGEWGTLLNFEKLSYLLYPREAVTFLSLWSILLLLFTSCLFIYIGIKAYRKYITNFSYPLENKRIKITQIIIIPIFLFVGLRGGFQNSPINELSVDYSNIPINNAIATNNIWYLVHSIFHKTATISE